MTKNSKAINTLINYFRSEFMPELVCEAYVAMSALTVAEIEAEVSCEMEELVGFVNGGLYLDALEVAMTRNGQDAMFA